MIARFLAFCCVFLLGACGTWGDFFATGQPACEPSTGQTYTVRLRTIEGKTGGSAERAAVADGRCMPPGLGAQKIEAKVLCLAADGQSLAVAWDEAKGGGLVLVSSTKLPGCLK